MPHWSSLVVLFNIFRNDLYLSVKKSELHNFANVNTNVSAEDAIKDLMEKMETKSKTATECFKNNGMIVNPDKFQTMIVKK